MTGQFLYRRRDFIALIGGAAVAWPLAARAQPAERMRRVTVLMSTAKDDPQDATRLAAFARGLEELGWVIGRNLRTDYRWSSDDPDNARKYAAESYPSVSPTQRPTFHSGLSSNLICCLSQLQIDIR
jgi:hypothetical protein